MTVSQSSTALSAQRPSFLVIGAGAIGCLVGGKLALAGYPVTLVGRPAFAALVREQGLALIEDDVRRAVNSAIPAGSMQEALSTQPHYDIAILTVKSYDTAAALQDLQQATAGQAGVAVPAWLSLQNGVGNEETIAAAVGSAAVIAGSITTPVTMLAPNLVRVDRPSYRVGLSLWRPAASRTMLELAQAALHDAGFSVVRNADGRGLKWTKLLMNMLGNATSAILDRPPAEVFADPTLVDLEIDAWREAMATMAAAGIRAVNLGGYPFAWLAPLIRQLPLSMVRPLLRPLLRAQIKGARGGKMPSLHMDLHGGRRRSEIQWLNGAVVRTAQETGTAAPVNRTLTDTLLALLDDEGERVRWRHANARLVDAVNDARRRERLPVGSR